MSWTRTNLRISSALYLALLVYAAIPHFHADLHSDLGPNHAERPAAIGALPADGVLVADEAHESHSPSPVLDAHPCALCRDKTARAMAVVHPEPFRLEVCERSPCEPGSSALRAELLLARRHPARAPPLT
jgi:hypothetical protein